MAGPHLQIHVTHRSRGHVSGQNVSSPHSEGPRPPKLGRVLNQDEGTRPKKSRDSLIVRSREKSKPSYFLNQKKSIWSLSKKNLNIYEKMSAVESRLYKTMG